MKKAFKMLCLLLCLMICFSGCKNTSVEDETTTETPIESNDKTEEIAKKENITLPYNIKDGLNPYFAKSYENLYLSDLLYETLFVVDKSLNVTPQIAKNILINGNEAVVTIDKNHATMGSSPIDAYDVVYSFNLAKASYGFSGLLNGITSATVINSEKVTFSLSYSNINIAGKLNFPICKSGTADGAESIPTGSGAYYFKNGELVNKADSNKIIKLKSVGKNDTVMGAFKIGAIDVYYSDLGDCIYSATDGITENILLNNMVYLGFNSANGALDSSIRSAISLAVSSEDISKFSFEGHAVPTKIPVNPNSAGFEKISQPDLNGNKEKAIQILDRGGYIRYAGKAKTNGKYVLSLNLIVNSENKFRVAAAYNIADSLNEIGFYCNVSVLSFADYNERIASGNFDMYLGEIKLDGAGDFAGFFLEGTPYGMGIDKTLGSSTKYFEYLQGKITADEYFKIFYEDVPFLPICYRKGYVVSSKGVHPTIDLMPFSLYKNWR